MKVIQNPPVVTAGKSPKVKATDNGDPKSFQRLLSEARYTGKASISPSSGTQTADAMAGLEGAASLARIQAVENGSSGEGLHRIRATLDRLESYQRQLADPRISLKEMLPAVHALEAGIHDLKKLEGEGSLAAGLSRIAAEVAVTAQVEVSKFYRGDYV